MRYPEGMQWWTRLKTRYAGLVAEYGMVALGTWFALAALTFGGFVIAIRMGIEVEGAAESAGTFGAAYVALQVTKPIRIAATLVLTPLVATVLRRRRAEIPEPVAEAAPERAE